MTISKAVGWILYAGLIWYAVGGFFGIRKAAKSGESITKMGLFLWVWSLASILFFGINDTPKFHLVWVIPFGVALSFSAAGMSIGGAVGYLTQLLFRPRSLRSQRKSD